MKNAISGRISNPGMWYLAWMEEGEVIRVDDDVVGFSGGKIGRPYLIVRVIGEPPTLVYVVPRTTTGLEGVPVPAGAVQGLNKEGRFLVFPHAVPAEDLRDAPVLGRLPEPHLTSVMERVRTDFLDLDP